MREASQGPGTELAELTAEYEILGELGRGGSAVVYRGRDRGLGRDVAIKVVHPRPLSADDDAVARLAREARTVAQLQHPSIVTVYAVRRLAGGGLALVMQLVPGRTLKAMVVRDGPFAVDRCERVLRDVASALAYAHSRGVIHRDVKPENIFVDEDTGRALLSDFGIARSEEHDSMTLTGTAIGTPFYMSPEQIDGGQVDGRSDLYSLGLVAWEMLTGRRPWDGESLYNVIYKQKHEQLPPIEAIRPGAVPPRLQYIIERMLQKNATARWAGADGLLSQLSHTVLPGDYGKWQATLRKRVERYHAAERERARATVPAPTSEGTVGGGLLASTMRFLRGDPRDPRTSRGPSQNGNSAADVSALANTQIVPRDGTLPLAPPPVDEAASSPEVATAHPAAVSLVAAATPGRQASTTPTWAVPVTPQRWAWLGGGTLVAAALLLVAALLTPRAAWEQLALRLRTASRSVSASDPRPRVAAPVPAPPTAVVDSPAASTAPPSTTSALTAPLAVGERSRSLVSLGDRHTCVVTSVGTVECWGANERGQLGDGTAARQRLPVAVAAELSFASVASGQSHSCGVTTQGDVYCWGNDAAGQLGDATTVRRNAPVRVAGPGIYRTVATGDSHSCATTVEGSVHCWGANVRGQLGDGTTTMRRTPTRTARVDAVRFVQVVVGSAHSCALSSEGEAYCWGANDRGQLGLGTTTDAHTPTPIPGLRFVGLVAGQNHTCGLLADGGVRCWGANNRGQLGTGSGGRSTTPTVVRLAVPAVALAAGSQHTCALSPRGEAYCWGANNAGQLGDSTAADSSTPTHVQSSIPLATIAAGGAHTCGATVGGELFCWGNDGDGQLGDGASTNRATPSVVALGTGLTVALPAPARPSGGT